MTCYTISLKIACSHHIVVNRLHQKYNSDICTNQSMSIFSVLTSSGAVCAHLAAAAAAAAAVPCRRIVWIVCLSHKFWLCFML